MVLNPLSQKKLNSGRMENEYDIPFLRRIGVEERKRIFIPYLI